MRITLGNLKVIWSIIKAYKNKTDNNIVGILKKKLIKNHIKRNLKQSNLKKPKQTCHENKFKINKIL
jgi:hypothetical protein